MGIGRPCCWLGVSQLRAHSGHSEELLLFLVSAACAVDRQRSDVRLRRRDGLQFHQADKTSEFEGVVAKLSEALQKSDKPERKQQVVSWKVFRAIEPGANGSVLYIFTIDPAVKGVDYTVSTILAEAFPTEVQALYKEYADAYATGQNVLNLKLVSALGH
jgi:hypothetical protein